MEQGTTTTSNNSMKTGLIAVALIVLLLGATVFYTQSQNKKNTAQMTPTTAPSQTMQNDAMMKKSDSSYKNGSYEATGNYISPGGSEEIGVKITLTDGVISDATVTPMTERPTSKRYQSLFAENYKSLVVGKNIDEVQLDKVAGSSLAPKGFNDALTKIKEQAKS